MAVLIHILNTDYATYCGLSRHFGVGAQPHISDAKHATCKICREKYKKQEEKR